METFQTPVKTLIPPNIVMNTVSANLRTKLRFFNPSKLRPFSASSTDFANPRELINGKNCREAVLKDSFVVNVKVSNAEVKEKWLDSLCCPEKVVASNIESYGVDLDWIIGIDPDVSGALALIKGNEFGYSAEVFDNPHVQVLVGKRVRRRLDAKSIVQMLQSFGAPFGTTAYIEQSTPFPQDGKLGWWSGGFGYGLWIGVLVASGYSVVPISSKLWKNHFQLSGSRSSKDDSRKAASTLFPSLSSLLKRKKDHGRAEALLIAAYGKGLQIKPGEIELEEAIDIKSEAETLEIKSEELCTALT